MLLMLPMLRALDRALRQPLVEVHAGCTRVHGSLYIRWSGVHARVHGGARQGARGSGARFAPFLEGCDGVLSARLEMREK